MWPAAKVGGVSQRSQPRASRTSRSWTPAWPKCSATQPASAVVPPSGGDRKAATAARRGAPVSIAPPAARQAARPPSRIRTSAQPAQRSSQ